MTDADLALSILRKMAVDPTDWSLQSTHVHHACLESCWIEVTDEERDLLARLAPWD